MPETPSERTAGALAGWIREARQVIRDCDDDKAALRAFYQGLGK